MPNGQAILLVAIFRNPLVGFLKQTRSNSVLGTCIFPLQPSILSQVIAYRSRANRGHPALSVRQTIVEKLCLARFSVDELTHPLARIGFRLACRSPLFAPLYWMAISISNFAADEESMMKLGELYTGRGKRRNGTTLLRPFALGLKLALFLHDHLELSSIQ